MVSKFTVGHAQHLKLNYKAGPKQYLELETYKRIVNKKIKWEIMKSVPYLLGLYSLFNTIFKIIMFLKN